MKKISSILLALALFLFTAGVVYAANATDTIGASVDGSPICTLSITSSDLTVTAPTGVGPSTTTFTNSPIEMEVVDNVVSPSALTNFLTVRATGTAPEQYWDGAGVDAYYIQFSTATWTASADNEVTPVICIMDPYALYSEDSIVGRFGASPTGKVLHGTFSLPASLIIVSDTRLYGDTADSITIQFTFVDL